MYIEICDGPVSPLTLRSTNMLTSKITEELVKTFISDTSTKNYEDIVRLYPEKMVKKAQKKGFIKVFTIQLPRIGSDSAPLGPKVKKVSLTGKGRSLFNSSRTTLNINASDTARNILIGITASVLGGLILFFVFGIG